MPNYQGPARRHGILILLVNGTATTAGTVTITNGAAGTTVSKPLPPNSTTHQCIEIVQQAAFQAGLQIQSQPDGSGLRIFGTNNVVYITQASISVSQF